MDRIPPQGPIHRPPVAPLPGRENDESGWDPYRLMRARNLYKECTNGLSESWEADVERWQEKWRLYDYDLILQYKECLKTSAFNCGGTTPHKGCDDCAMDHEKRQKEGHERKWKERKDIGDGWWAKFKECEKQAQTEYYKCGGRAPASEL